MAIEIQGYYKLPHDIYPRLVNFNEVFTDSFMRKFSRFKSFEKFLTGGPFTINNQQDFEALPENLMDLHVKKTTRFENWQEMLDFATDKYILRSQQQKEGSSDEIR